MRGLEVLNPLNFWPSASLHDVVENAFATHLVSFFTCPPSVSASSIFLQTPSLNCTSQLELLVLACYDPIPNTGTFTYIL